MLYKGYIRRYKEVLNLLGYYTRIYNETLEMIYIRFMYIKNGLLLTATLYDNHIALLRVVKWYIKKGVG